MVLCSYETQHIIACTLNAGLVSISLYTVPTPPNFLNSCLCFYTLLPIVCINTQWRRSALMLAAGHGHTPIVEILVQKGADVNTQDRVC